MGIGQWALWFAAMTMSECMSGPDVEVDFHCWFYCDYTVDDHIVDLRDWAYFQNDAARYDGSGSNP